LGGIVLRRSGFLCLLLAAAPAAAQIPADGRPPVRELPGVGRAVDAEAYAARRARLAERVETGVIVVPAGGRQDLELLVLQDNDFRQDDYFYYLTGLETPGAWLLIVASDGAVETTALFLPRVNPMMMRWTGIQLGPGEDAVRLTGIPQVVEASREALERALARQDAPLFTTRWAGTERNQFLEAWEASGKEFGNVVPVLDSLRQVKDSLGLRSLRRAIAITAEGVSAGMRAAHPGMWEYQLEATIEYTFRNLGADRVGFPSIVGSGPNSTTLHYDVSRRRMEEGDLVVVDVGAEYAMYTADITRTFPVSGRFTERQREIYELVLETQNAIIEAIRPGVTLQELTLIARTHMAEHSGDVCGENDCTRYFIHGVSHWLGMRVHDVGDGRRALEPGMVLTVEPGVYIPEENLGVRIEDDVLVTEDGHEVLSVGAPKTVEDIERTMRSGDRRTETRE
jgi:Xaa-Pro aminopeptidase